MSLKSKVIKSSSVLLASFMLLGVNVSASTLTDNLVKCNKNNPYHILVNESHQLSKDYVPSNLVIPNVKFASSGNIERNYMEATAGKALENMFNGAKKEGVTLIAVSGYRGYTRQSALYNNAIKQYGVNQKGSAKPNASEHRTGLAMDVNSVSQSFGNTKEGKWLASNAHKYGYIIRYPQGKTNITGYMYEPWHIRYVGVELATYCYQNNVTLEEIDFCCGYEEITKNIRIPNLGTTLYNVPMLLDNGTSYIKVRDITDTLGLGLEVTPSGVRLSNVKGMGYDLLSIVVKSTKGVEKENKTYGDGVRLNTEFKTLTIDGRLYVPVRAVLNLIGYNIQADGVDWVFTKTTKETEPTSYSLNILDEVDAEIDEHETNKVYAENYNFEEYIDGLGHFSGVEEGHATYTNEYGDRVILGCSETCIYGYRPTSKN